MKKIIEYEVASSKEKESMISVVNRLIKEGWQPYGDAVSSGFAIYQPMVKYEEEKAE